MTMLPELIYPHHCCHNPMPLRLTAFQLPAASGHSRASLFRRRWLNVRVIAPSTSVQRLAAAPSRGPRIMLAWAAGAPVPPLDLTEDNIKQVLADARVELAQLFDSSVRITGEVELAEMDGPFVKISLRGRFWHERSVVLARVGNYLKQRIPEILEVDVEDEKMLDDSPENF